MEEGQRLAGVVFKANEFTLEYGDIDEGYYESMEGAFHKAVNHLLLMDKGSERFSRHFGRGIGLNRHGSENLTGNSR